MATDSERGGLQPTPEECNPLVFLRGLKDNVEVRFAHMEKTLATNPISMYTLQMRIENLERAWTEFKAQYDRLRTIAGRGRLQGLQAYHATLQRHYWVHIEKAEDTLEEEQAKEAALKKVVIYGQKIAAWEQSIQAKADAKAAEKKSSFQEGDHQGEGSSPEEESLREG